MPETFQATLVATKNVTPRVKQFTFERTDAAPFTFKSGQWVSLVLPIRDAKDRAIRRSYSIASAPGSTPRFELLITRVDDGSASAWLHDAPVGTRLEVKGPQGMFLREHAASPSLVVATGTGVAPFRGMIHDAIAARNSSPLWVLFGIRSLHDAIFYDEFRALEAQHPHLRFLPTLSQPDATWTGLTGYVQTHVLALWRELAVHGTPHVYICGVKKMLIDVRDTLKTHAGLERSQLHLESYD